VNTEETTKKWTIQRNWQHRVHKTKTNKTKTKQYVLDTIIRKQTQMTHISDIYVEKRVWKKNK